MNITKEFIQKRIKEQSEYIEDKKDESLTILTAYQDKHITFEEFKEKSDRYSLIIESALAQKTYFEVLLIQKNNGN